MLIFKDFITVEEEDNLLRELEVHLKRLRYEYDHWDDAIHGYRETERKSWKKENQTIVDRIRNVAFEENSKLLPLVHVLDLSKDGWIKPHVDSVKFCGDTIAGISLLSSAVMRLINEGDKTKFGDVLLERRSLYVMK
ncbi:DgyrCDS13432 [Dimorphilus gyrociliatus]|uniref:DgyrCDS13432 n=1 Tax=Dimorphilus gyrociliatus TaxID=2664684 RepID=A0A7I8WAP1_9ANNE|nr:DgyrCDS13432 [Dimorphilus gyrociliatus]